MRTVTEGDTDVVCVVDWIVVAEFVGDTEMLVEGDRDKVVLAVEDELNDGEGEVVPQDVYRDEIVITASVDVTVTDGEELNDKLCIDDTLANEEGVTREDFE